VRDRTQTHNQGGSEFGGLQLLEPVGIHISGRKVHREVLVEDAAALNLGSGAGLGVSEGNEEPTTAPPAASPLSGGGSSDPSASKSTARRQCEYDDAAADSDSAGGDDNAGARAGAVEDCLRARRRCQLINFYRAHNAEGLIHVESILSAVHGSKKGNEEGTTASAREDTETAVVEEGAQDNAEQRTEQDDCDDQSESATITNQSTSTPAITSMDWRGVNSTCFQKYGSRVSDYPDTELLLHGTSVKSSEMRMVVDATVNAPLQLAVSYKDLHLLQRIAAQLGAVAKGAATCGGDADAPAVPAMPAIPAVPPPVPVPTPPPTPAARASGSSCGSGDTSDAIASRTSQAAAAAAAAAATVEALRHQGLVVARHQQQQQAQLFLHRCQQHYLPVMSSPASPYRSLRRLALPHLFAAPAVSGTRSDQPLRSQPHKPHASFSSHRCVAQQAAGAAAAASLAPIVEVRLLHLSRRVQRKNAQVARGHHRHRQRQPQPPQQQQQQQQQQFRAAKVTRRAADFPPPPCGFAMLPLNLNAGTVGKPLYLCYRRAGSGGRVWHRCGHGRYLP